MFNKVKIEGTTETPNPIDSCVCNAYIGAVFVGTTNRIFIKVDDSNPCVEEDWVEITNVDASGFFFAFVGDSGFKTVTNESVLTLNGVSGITVGINNNLFTIDGHLYSSSAAPVAPPTETHHLSFHINTTNNNIYAWNPTTNQWALIKTAETITTLVNNGNGTYTYTNESGTQTTFGFAQTNTTLTNNNNGTITYTNEQNNAVTISILDIINQYAVNLGTGLAISGNTLQLKNALNQVISTVTLPTSQSGAETVTTLVDNEDGTYTYTSEDNTETTFSAIDIITTLSFNSSTGVLTYINETGIATDIILSVGGLVLNQDSNIGPGYLVENVLIDQNGLLIDAAPEYIVATANNNNNSVTISPITALFSQATITMDITNPSIERAAKAQIVFTGYPISITTTNSATTTVIVAQEILINNVAPADYTNLPSKFKLTPNSQITAITQGYSGVVSLNPGQTIHVVISLDITTE